MTDVSSAWVQVYSAQGHKIGVTVVIDPEQAGHALQLLLADLTAHGFTAHEQGIEAGEQVATLAKFSVRDATNLKGKSWVVDTFADASHEKRHMGIYLNTPEQWAEFEQMTGWKFADMPINQGDNSAKETDKLTKDTIIRPRKPVRYVWMKNPDYDESKEYNQQAKANTPARLFVRWMPSAEVGQPVTVNPTPPSKSEQLFDQMGTERSQTLQNAAGSKNDSALAENISFTAARVESAVTGAGKRFYRLVSTDNQRASSWTRDPFKMHLVEPDFHKLETVGTVIEIDWIVTASLNKDGYYNVTSVKPGDGIPF